MSVTLRQLRAFIAVVRTGSFTSAAESLHVTQSALSGLIKELEQTLGVQVFDRTTRRLELSDVGSEFYPLVDKLVLDLDGALGEINNLKALKKGLVRVAVPQLMACTLLPDVINSYRQQYPNVQVQLVDCGVESVVSRVLSGEVDIGVGPERDLVSGIDAMPLFELPFMLVFPKKHPLEKKRRLTWDEAMRYPFIALQGQFSEKLALDLHASLRGLTLNPSNEVTFMTTALAMVSAELGVAACLPYAESLVKLYQLQMRRLHEPEVTRRFFVFSRHGRSPLPAAQSFAEFLLDYVERKDMAKYR
ncbi:MAG TPA: LysR substrate-binding domain-containing protein [Noviherbaspirillum sp.]|uniref:LysR family transcriptional regulator n=1 Tax=Noviherbaspirillum sp. TaxID=1926288 RepID=UPI002B467EED|nr:LysR substrate-binding domain-containing protein [Noviherbaspirillum sp.]HJV87649.1 LysR substrate-binding domain-containing protein [Noviherbaspirillum sp.]